MIAADMDLQQVFVNVNDTNNIQNANTTPVEEINRVFEEAIAAKMPAQPGKNVNPLSHTSTCPSCDS
jgi:hypothetical protein